MIQIKQTTRRNIFDSILIEGLDWSGKLTEPDFLSRVFDLSKLPSTDYRFKDAYGDIWQHRVNNEDWTSDWLFTDRRFNLLECDDTTFLQFLCEVLHPVVRSDFTEVSKVLQWFNQCLREDGFELVEKAKIAERPLFIGRQVLQPSAVFKKTEIVNALSADYVTQKINMMEVSIETSPDIAIGMAKELVETICKTVLKQRAVKIEKSWDLPRLLKETSKQLKLSPKDIDNQVRAAETIKTILGSLSAVVQGIAELRNDYGSGHGKDANFKGLSSRHAKLAVGAASTLAVFLIETNKEKE